MKSLLGLYLDPNDAANAMDGLAEGGFEQGTFDVLTGTPYPEAAFGAIIGFSLSLFLTTATQLAYPLITGGKPILSIFAMLIIMYEMTMLSAVIFSVIGIIFESRLPNIAPGVYDGRITEGYIGVVISVQDSEFSKAKKILEKSGSEEIKEA